MSEDNNSSREISKQNDIVVLETLAESLTSARETTGKCPSQKQGTEIDGTPSNYCPLPAIHCKHLGKPRCYDNGDFKLENHHECKYEQRATSDEQ